MASDAPQPVSPKLPDGAPVGGESLAAGLRGFGPVGIAALLVILFTGNIVIGRMLVLPLGAALVLIWAHWSRTPWPDLGYARPRSWTWTVAGGLLFGVAFKLLLKAVVMPLLGFEPVNTSYHFLAGNGALLPVAVWAMFAAGFGEETVFRGYLFERLGRLIGPGPRARVMIVLLTALWFGASHYLNQGWTGVAQGTVFGLVFGAIATQGGRLWLLMIAHTAFDLTALGLIYWDIETAVAHLLF